MTAIAYRAGVLAADTQQTAGMIIVGYTKKVVRSPAGHIAAASGDAVWCRAFNQAVTKGDVDWKPPAGTKAEDFMAILVSPDGTAEEVVPEGNSLLEAEFAAIGAPWQFLTGAMAAGASAEEAVRLAIQHCTSCGGEVQVERLDAVPRGTEIPHHPV